MRRIAFGLLAIIGVAACAQEGQVNKARTTPQEQLLQEQQRQQERDRVIQEQRAPTIPR